MSSTNHRPTILFVPGSWHTTAHAEGLINAFRQQNYKAETHQLASVGLKSPRPTFADEVSTIKNAVSKELNTGQDVCLVLHSYAGVPGAQATNELIAQGALHAANGKGKLVRVVFLAAYVFPAGFVMDAKMFTESDPGFTIEVRAATTYVDS
jgi:hypothetical protein